MLSPDGRVVMVSGAGRGLGAAIAHRLYADGYGVSLGARDVGALDRAWDGRRDRVAAFRHEAREAGSARAWVERTVERFGRIDGLINNAGVLRRFTIEGACDDELDLMWQVNAKAPLQLTQAAFPHLKRSGAGRIVNVASLSGLRVKRTDFVGYSMTKFALVALTHAARQEGWEHGIRATALCPSIVDTDMAAGLGMPREQLVAPETVAAMVSVLLALPNNASVAELPINIFSEPGY
ncbi:MAG: SDR family NAD(P)-dependent oxidoreductase [Alphaproteobacteria bacterium]